MGLSKDPEKRKRQLENLKKRNGFENSSERASNAAKKSHASYREHKTQREILLAWMNQDTTGEDGKPKQSRFFPGQRMKNAELISSKKIQLVKDGNLEAIKYVEKQVGEAPDERLSVNVNGSVTTSGELRIGFSDDMFEEE